MCGDAMRRVLLVPLAVLSPVLLLVGCEGGGAPPPGPLGPTEGLRAGFTRHGLADTIAIDAIERLPLRAAVLVAPDGTVVPASNIDVADTPRFATGQWAFGNMWHNAVTGGGPAALTVPQAEPAAALQGQQQLLATVSSADIALPDPVAYRRDWPRYRIRLTFGTPPGEIETREIAAPEPSPGS
jgi:hypothetical protein